MKVNLYTVDKRLDLSQGKSRGDELYPCRIELSPSVVDLIERISEDGIKLLEKQEPQPVLRKDFMGHSEIRPDHTEGITYSIGMMPKIMPDKPLGEPCALKVRIVKNDMPTPELPDPYIVDIGYHDVSGEKIQWRSVSSPGGFNLSFSPKEERSDLRKVVTDWGEQELATMDFFYCYFNPKPKLEYFAWEIVGSNALAGGIGYFAETWLDPKNEEFREKYPANRAHVEHMREAWEPVEKISISQTADIRRATIGAYIKMLDLVDAELGRIKKEGAVRKEYVPSSHEKKG